ncbi:hypothetical protein BGZ54_008068 [Gamsiella multidivaricata]|nr:hypothetical protein BGZ54_008068 [Gamsiella multidivaricata]
MGAGCFELSHFHLLRSVGKGAFGKVRVVQHKKTKEIYALKYINKAKCIRMRAVENIIQERRLLEEVEFSLICNLRYAFQDDENLFMVLDLMLGGDLRFHLERAGPMREDVVRFYVAELALALNALHLRRIIHRDLKPDNVLLDEHGHAHLTDFNIAVYYNPSKPLLSIAGSMAYMAPEVLLRKGYFESVDWWSLGVVMFELLFGKRPFRGKSNDLLTSSILRDPLPFPENVQDMVSVHCLDVLSKLCERDISKRLGCTPDGLDAFKKHPWFQGIEWNKLVTKEAVPPFEPDSKRANFDATHELEELLMEDNPLKAKKRAQMTPETELSTEMQMMEDKFTVYDFTKVRRSHSLNRGRILRPSNDPKMNSGTLDGVVTRTNSGCIEISPVMPPPKVYRPDSPSDRVGRDRFNSDEDQVSLTNPMYRNSPLSSPALKATPNKYAGNDSYQYRPDAEKAGYFELQEQPQQPQKRQQLRPDAQYSDNMMQSEAIMLPPLSLPRPLQPKDDVTGLRIGSPCHRTSTAATVGTIPASSPPNSFAQPTLTSFTIPATNHGSSSQQQQQQRQRQSRQSESFPFSSVESDLSLTSYAATANDSLIDPLQDSVMVPPISRRAVRGRESSEYSSNSMPAAVSPSSPNHSYTSSVRQGTNNNNITISSSPRRPLDMGPQQWSQQYQQQMRPMSAYTTSMSGSQLDDGPVRQPIAYQWQPSVSSVRAEDRNMHRQPSYASTGHDDQN